MNADQGVGEELLRIRRVSDMLCTAHACLRDHYARMALGLDLSILGLSVWLSALAFVSPKVNVSLTPFALDPQLWAGLLSVAVLFLAILQLKTDWKGRSDAHHRTMHTYAEIKRQVGYLLATGDLEQQACRRILAQYDMASVVGVEVPERVFLSLKQRPQDKGCTQ